MKKSKIFFFAKTHASRNSMLHPPVFLCMILHDCPLKHSFFYLYIYIVCVCLCVGGGGGIQQQAALNMS